MHIIILLENEENISFYSFKKIVSSKIRDHSLSQKYMGNMEAEYELPYLSPSVQIFQLLL